jgi:hypothetical protein
MTKYKKPLSFSFFKIKLHLDNEKKYKTNRKVRTGETKKTPRGTFSSSCKPLSLHT